MNNQNRVYPSHSRTVLQPELFWKDLEEFRTMANTTPENPSGINWGRGRGGAWKGWNEQYPEGRCIVRHGHFRSSREHVLVRHNHGKAP